MRESEKKSAPPHTPTHPHKQPVHPHDVIRALKLFSIKNLERLRFVIPAIPREIIDIARSKICDAPMYTHTHTHTQPRTHIERQRNMHTDKKTDKTQFMYMYIYICHPSYPKIKIARPKIRDAPLYIQTDIYTHTHTQTQTHTQRERERERKRERKRDNKTHFMYIYIYIHKYL